MNKAAISILVFASIAVTTIVIAACGTLESGRTFPTPEASGPYEVSTEYAVVTPTSIDLPEGWWNPIDEKKLEQIEYSLVGIRMWGNCVWYFDDPSPATEAAVRMALSDVINSPIANSIGIIEGADLEAVCEGSAAVSDIDINVTDGRRAAIASDLMVDLLDSCVTFYATPDAPLAYRIATNFMDMLWMLELDSPRWPRRDFWGVREWCDNVVEGAVAS